MSVSGLYTGINSGKMKIETLEKIASVLNTPIYNFFAESSNPPNQEEIEQLKKRITELEEQLDDKKELLVFYKNRIAEITSEDLTGELQAERIMEMKFYHYNEQVDIENPDLANEIKSIEEALVDDSQSNNWHKLNRRFNKLINARQIQLEELLSKDTDVQAIYKRNTRSKKLFLRYMNEIMEKRKEDLSSVKE
jgi:transcriptional regulator with XRE-family HTH domain